MHFLFWISCFGFVELFRLAPIGTRNEIVREALGPGKEWLFAGNWWILGNDRATGEMRLYYLGM